MNNVDATFFSWLSIYFLTNLSLLFFPKGRSPTKVQESLISHLYEELAKRKALVEQVNKLQSEVDQLDSKATVPEKSTSYSLPSARVNMSINTKPAIQPINTVTAASSTSSRPIVSINKPPASATPVSNSSPSDVSKPSAVMSIPSGTFVSPPQQQYSTVPPQLVNTYQPMLRTTVSVPVQMVSFVDKDGKLLATTTTSKTKQTKQKGNAKKKPRVSPQSKPAVGVTLSSSPVIFNPQTVSVVASPTTPTVSMWQSPSVSRPHQPLITSPVTPVSASSRPGSERMSALSLVTSPVTPTPVRQVPSDLSSVVSLPASSVSPRAVQRSSSEVPQMVSFVQSGLSCISPLSPLSGMSGASRPLMSGATPLSSLSASTEKYLNTFTTQSSVAPRPSFSTASRSPPVSTTQPSYAGRTSFFNTDLSTHHSAGIKLFCDLLNDTLPEQPPPLVATSLAVRSLGTPTSVASDSSIPDSSRVEQSRHPSTPPTLPSKATSKSPRTPPIGNTVARQSPEGVTSSVEQTTSAQRTPPTAVTPPAGKKSTSPFAIENLVSSSPEKSKSTSEAEVGKRHPSPASGTNKSSPKGKNKSPSTNFSIAHITRDMNTVNATSKERVPFVTGPATCSVPASVSSGGVEQHQRSTSPPVPRISNPGTEGSVVEFSGVMSMNAVQSSTGPDSRFVCNTNVEIQRQRVSAPEARVCGSPTEMSPHVQSSLVSDQVTRSVDPSQETGCTQAEKTDGSISSPQQTAAHKSLAPQLSSPTVNPSSSKEVQPDSVSSEVSSSIPTSTLSPEHRQYVPSAEDVTAEIIPKIPLNMIPLPSGKRPSPKNRKSPTNLSGKTSSVGSKKRCSPIPQIPKSASPDSEVSSLMTNESLPQSPSISSSVSKAGTAVLEGQAPVLVDSNPCSARSPIPVAPSSTLQPLSGVSLPSFGSVFSLTKEGKSVTSEDTSTKNR